MQGVKRLLLQYSSRGATFDRYATIRNFFRQQRRAATPYAFHPETHTTALRTTISLRARVVIRQFCQDAVLRQNSHRGEPKDANEDGQGALPPRKDAGEDVNLENYPRFFRRLAKSLPHLQRPTRDDFLKAADGFWQRFRIRFRWLTIRSFRRYNADDLSAFFTWFLMSQTLWLFVGT